MTKLYLMEYPMIEEDYYQDILKMVEIAETHGFELHPSLAMMAWGNYSSDMDASWMMLNSDEETWQILRKYLSTWEEIEALQKEHQAYKKEEGL